MRRTLAVLPTGSGKTIIFSLITSDIVAGGGRVLILADRDELIRQAADKLHRTTGLDCAIEKADEYANGCLERVIVGSVQTLVNPVRRERIFPPTHIIVDECDKSVSPSFQQVLAHWPEAHVIGVTATPNRSDLVNLGVYYESKAFEYTLPQAIKDGFLCPIRALTLPVKVDLSAMQNGGDFTLEQCATALDPVLPALTASYAENARDRKGLIFVPLCATGQKVVDHLKAQGIRAYYCSGEDRSQIAAWEADGRGSCMVNAMLLNRGYDHPPIDAIAVWRFTRSESFYSQMVGRGTRLAPGKENLLILDHLYLSKHNDLCRSANLIAESDEVAAAMMKAQDAEPGTEKAVDEQAEEAARQEVISDREAALAKKLDEMRHRKRELVDPIQYAASIGDAAMLDYKPVFGAEAAPVTQAQQEALAKAGIFPSEIQSSGHAEHILAKLEERRQGAMASPKMIRCLERYGFKHVGGYPYKKAQGLILRIRANGWRLPGDLVEKVNKQKG